MIIMRRSTGVKLLLLLLSLLSVVHATGNSRSIILRVRLLDGRMERLALSSQQDLLITDALKPFLTTTADDTDIVVLHNDNNKQSCLDPETTTVASLKNGTLLTLKKATKQTQPTTLQKQQRAVLSPAVEKQNTQQQRWDPFPDLAKDYRKALIKTKRKRATGTSSYSVLADVQSELHVLEPQKEGPIRRVYVCGTSAATFQANCVNQKKQTVQNRIGLLLGKIQRERKDQERKPRTSLSSTTDADEYCQVAKIHAIWEPPQKSGDEEYDESSMDNSIPKNVLQIAQALELKPIGWIYSYTDDRHNNQDDTDSLPVLGQDIRRGASLQIDSMKREGRQEGAKFVTLAMHARDGATEAFQLSDVAVQMVAEGMLEGASGRFVKTKHPVVVDGREVSEIDTVLCLVNTAVLQHEGSFSCKGNLKKSGGLTGKTKKKLLSLLENGSDSDVLAFLSDFGVLAAVSNGFTEKETALLCENVRRFVIGRKKTAVLDDSVKQRLLLVLT